MKLVLPLRGVVPNKKDLGVTLGDRFKEKEEADVRGGQEVEEVAVVVVVIAVAAAVGVDADFGRSAREGKVGEGGVDGEGVGVFVRVCVACLGVLVEGGLV